MVSAAETPAPGPRWIVSQTFDLGWFFGGAAGTVAVLALFFGAGVPIVAIWWAWTLFSDGPHIGAALTRSYADRREWERSPGVLVNGLLVFLAGPAFLVLNAALGSEEPFQLFLGGVTFYAYYHVVRQHYGFVALYKAVNGDREDFVFDRWCVYIGCWAPYAYFLLTHPKARALLSLPGAAASGAWELGAVWLSAALWAGVTAAFLARAAARPRRANLPKTAYLGVVLLLYGAIYFFVARYEPVYALSQGPDQDFMLLSVLISLIHGVQYVGLVWFHNRNHYASRGAEFGAASWVNAGLGRYLACCLLFAAFYGLSACSTAVFPVCQLFRDLRAGPWTASQLALSFWWGLALQHYYLDQKIWRIKDDQDLRRDLGLA